MTRWKGAALAACIVIGAQSLAIPGFRPALTVYADNASQLTYYCVSSLPPGTPFPSKRMDAYPSPQPGMNCYADENEAFHYAYNPFFACVTDDAGTWQITEYNWPQQGQTCYWTSGEALHSLPASVTEIVPPGGSVDPVRCVITANAADPQQWGHVYFVRCTPPDRFGNPQIRGAVSYHLVNGIPTVSDGPAPFTDLSTWTEPGTPPSWTPAPTPVDAPSVPPAAQPTPPPGVTGTLSLRTLGSVVIDAYERLGQSSARLLSARYSPNDQAWVIKIVGACPRGTAPCGANMGSYLKVSAINGTVLAMHAIRFYKPVLPTNDTITVFQAIKVGRTVLPGTSDDQALARATSATLEQLRSGSQQGKVAWVLTFAAGAGQSTTTQVTVDAKDGTIIPNP